MRTIHKVMILVVCFICSVIGFLMKIPVPLRGNDKLLHTGFYFCAAAFLHLLFRRGLIIILACLAVFGVMIEYLQELSNKVLHKRIHGRFDIEDVYANLKGLAIYTVIAVVFLLLRAVVTPGKNDANAGNPG